MPGSAGSRRPGSRHSALGVGSCVHNLTLPRSPQSLGAVAQSHQPAAWPSSLWSGCDVPSHAPERRVLLPPPRSCGCCRLQDPDGPLVTHL